MDATTDRPLRPHEYVVEVNGTSRRVYCPPGGVVEVDGREVSVRLVATKVGHGHLELEGVLYGVVFDTEEPSSREFSIQVNGRELSGTVDDRRSLLRSSMRGPQDAGLSGSLVKAPMPGLVLRILVSAGQEVAKGQGLLVLEAMKMENEVRSDRPGTIETIHVAEGGPVEKGQPLISIV